MQIKYNSHVKIKFLFNLPYIMKQDLATVHSKMNFKTVYCYYCCLKYIKKGLRKHQRRVMPFKI